MINLIKNSKGFSLIQVMIGIGLMAGLSVYMLKMQDNSNKFVKEQESKFEITEVSTKAQAIVLNKDTCEKNFAGKRLGKSITSLRNSRNSKILQTGKIYGLNTKVKVIDLLIDGIDTAAEGSTIPIYSPDQFHFKIKMEKVGRFSGRKEVERRIVVMAVIEDDIIKECKNSQSTIIDEGTRRSCEQIGGELVLVDSVEETYKCVLSQDKATEIIKLLPANVVSDLVINGMKDIPNTKIYKMSDVVTAGQCTGCGKNGGDCRICNGTVESDRQCSKTGDNCGTKAWRTCTAKCTEKKDGLTVNPAKVFSHYEEKAFQKSKCGNTSSRCPSGWETVSTSCSNGVLCGVKRWKDCTSQCKKAHYKDGGSIGRVFLID